MTEENRLDFDIIEKQLDGMIESGQLPSAAAIDDWIEEKATARKGKSKLKIRRTTDDMAYAGLYFQYLRDYACRRDAVPVYGSIDRDHYLSGIWKGEPILAGAVYSMSAKMVSLKWQVSGRRNLAIYYAKLLSRAAYMGGYGWGGFSSPSAEDFYTTDRGVFWEMARVGNPMYGKLSDIGHIDALQCTMTGNTKRPVHYLSALTGQSIRFKAGEIAHFASMNSPREENLGIGLCAVSRALRAAKLLIGLHDYDAEKLANLPPEGVAAITGLTIDEFHDALALWQSSRERDNSLTFPQVLWLIGSQPNSAVKVDFVGFSQLPESFDRQTVIQQYINTLALDFGVDTREFWAISSGALGTASETEVQHMKAKGKGHGEYITLTERILNDEMPDGVVFGYDTQDIEEDETAARVAKAWVEAFLPLTVAGGAAEAVIDNAMLLRLLADKNVIPDWMVQDDRVVADDMGVHEKDFTHDDVIVIEWDGRILKQKYSAAIDLSYRVAGRKQKKLLPDALDITPPTTLKVWEYKGGPKSGHRGHAGRPGKRGGSGAGVSGISSERAAEIAKSIKRMMPYDNRNDLVIPASGLPGARTKDGDIVDTIAYNPTTGDLLATGGIAHASMIDEYSATMRYDDYVKVVFATPGPPEYLGIDIGRVTSDDTADAWNKGYETAWALSRVGFPDDMAVKVNLGGWMQEPGERGIREFVLGDMKEVSKDELVVESTIGALRVKRYNTSWESTDAAVKFLKQAEATLEEEPKRGIRGKPIPEDEALRGASVTQSAIDHELELWRNHPLLSHYLPKEEVKIG